jgi:hypothetical protein
MIARLLKPQLPSSMIMEARRALRLQSAQNRAEIAVTSSNSVTGVRLNDSSLRSMLVWTQRQSIKQQSSGAE